jgi:ankyrin repeat protein
MRSFRNVLIRMIRDEVHTCDDVEAYIRRCRRHHGQCKALHQKHFWTGRTPLIEAVMAGRSRIVQVFLDSRVDVNVQDFKGNTALHYAVMAKRLDMVKRLCSQHIDMEIINHEKLTALLIAAGHGDVLTSSYLIDREVNLDMACTHTFLTPLMMAVMNKSYDLVKSLVDHGAELDFRDHLNGKTALMHAVGLGDHQSVQLLLDAGVNLLVKDFEGRNAWRHVCLAQDEVIMQMLLKHGGAIGSDLDSQVIDLEKYDVDHALLVDVRLDDVPLADCLDEHGHTRFDHTIVSVAEFLTASHAGYDFSSTVQTTLAHYVMDVPALRCFDRHTVIDRRSMVAYVLDVKPEAMPFIKGLDDDVQRVKMDYLSRISDMLSPLERVSGFVNSMDDKSKDLFGELCVGYADSSRQAGTLDDREPIYELVPKECKMWEQATVHILDHEYEKTCSETASPALALRKVMPIYQKLGFDFDLEDEIEDAKDLGAVHVTTEQGAHLQLELFARILSARQELETKKRNLVYFKKAS